MLKVQFEYDTKVTFQAYTLNGQNKDVIYRIMILSCGLEINLGTLHKLSKKKPGEVNYLFFPKDNPSDVKEIIAKNLSDAVLAAIK